MSATGRTPKFRTNDKPQMRYIPDFKMNANTMEKYDTKTKIFETLKYNISNNTDVLLDNCCDPDVNFLNKKFQSLDTPYLMSGEFHNFLDKLSDGISSHIASKY